MVTVASDGPVDGAARLFDDAVDEGDVRFLEWARRIGDAYIEEVLPGNFGVPGMKWDFTAHTGDRRLRLRDHGNETVVGLTLLFALEQQLGSDRVLRYRAAVQRMLDRILQSAQPDGMLYNEVDAETLAPLDKRLSAIPEVEVAVGKWGRVNSALDPAPVQMFENTINYRPEYVLDENGHRQRFKVDKQGRFLLNDGTTYHPGEDAFKVVSPDNLQPDPKGEYFRQWRPHIKTPNDIWNEIVKVTHIPGLTSAPKLQPIETRLVMLATGMRAPMGLKVYGPDLETIEKAGLEFEKALKHVPSVNSASVFYDRAVGAPYIEIKLNREALARYGMSVSDVQEILQVAVGGMALSVVGMCIAFGGWLPPVGGALFQEIIDLAAVLNALRAAVPEGELSDY